MTGEEEFNLLHSRLCVALEAADIMPTLRWSLALLSVGARVLCVLGVPCEMYLDLCSTMFEQSATAHALPRADFPSSEDLAGMRAHIVASLRQFGIPIDDVDVAGQLVAMAAGAAEQRGLMQRAWLAMCRASYADAESDMHELAREKGNRA